MIIFLSWFVLSSRNFRYMLLIKWFVTEVGDLLVLVFHYLCDECVGICSPFTAHKWIFFQRLLSSLVILYSG